jgi:hypothetical protein
MCDFVLTNRSYEIAGSVRLNDGSRVKRRAKANLTWLLDPLIRTDKTPSIEVRRIESRISDVYFLALRKLADDSRRFDHFVHF